jgi:hypothetical protein
VQPAIFSSIFCSRNHGSSRQFVSSGPNKRLQDSLHGWPQVQEACALHIWHHAQVASLWESKLATEPPWIRFAYGLIDHCHVSLPKAQLAPNVQLPKGRIWHWEPGTRMALAAHLAHMLQEGRPINSQARGVRDQKKLFRIKNKIKTLVSFFFNRNILRWWVGQKMSQNMFFWSGNGGIKML